MNTLSSLAHKALESQEESSKVAQGQTAARMGRKPLVSAIALALLAGSLAIPATGWAATDCTAVTQIPKAQCDALVSLYTSTNGAMWMDAATNNWNVTNTPCDNWAGVRCSNGNVTQILRRDVARDVSTKWKLPDFSALTGLQILDFSENCYSGGIPSSLVSLPSLQTLNLSHPATYCGSFTGLTGGIPNLSALTNLKELNLSGQLLGGTIPDLSKLTNLQVINLYGTKLFGTIPELATLTKLRVINLGLNQLDGNIPDLSKLINLQELRLPQNRLSGNVPNLSTLTNLQVLDLSNNQLTGNIPNWSGLSSLTTVYLQYNQLDGAIPNWSTLTGTQYIYLNNNKLSGPIPDPASLIKVAHLFLAGNQLCGNIPAALGDIPAVSPFALTLGGNRLIVPTDATQLAKLNGKITPQGDTWTKTQISTECNAPPQLALSVTATNGSISCNGTTCQTSYPTNTALTLTATPSSGYKFDSWGGACSGTTSCQVTMDVAKSVTANFSATTGTTGTTGSTGTTGTTGSTGTTGTTGNTGTTGTTGSTGTTGTIITTDCPNHAIYSLEDYRLTIPVVQVPLISLLGEAIGDSLYYEAILKQVNGTSDRFALQTVTQLVGVKTDDSCAVAHYSLDDSTVQLPYVDVAKLAYNPISKENYKAGVDTYAVVLKWMPVLGAEVFVVEEQKKLP